MNRKFPLSENENKLFSPNIIITDSSLNKKKNTNLIGVEAHSELIAKNKEFGEFII